MKKFKNQLLPRLLGGILVVLVSMTSATTAFARSSTAQTKTALINGTTVTKSSDLNFGNIISANAAGTVTVATNGNRTASGGAIPAGGTVTAATFLGYGNFGSRVRIRGPQNTTYTLSRIGGGATMIMRNMTTGVSNASLLPKGNSGQYVIDSTGPITIRVGGTIDVAANQTPGTYVGTFSVTLDYF